MADIEYTAPLPAHLNDDDIEALRGLGAVEFTYRVEAKSRREAVRMLADEYGWRGLDAAYWEEHLSATRRRR